MLWKKVSEGKILRGNYPMEETYTLLTRFGVAEKRPYITKVVEGNKVLYVSEHISKREVDDGFTGQVILFEPIIALFERARLKFGKGISINSGYRTPSYQKHLKELGLKVASDSPHSQGAALDLAIPQSLDCGDLREIFKWSAEDLSLPKPRFGYKLYDEKFLHVDLVFMLFVPYNAKKPNPHPNDWKPGVEW